MNCINTAFPLCNRLYPSGQRPLGSPHLDYTFAMKPEEMRAGMSVKVRDDHRIEVRRGLLGKVVSIYGGEEFTAVEVLFSDGQRRLFWPTDLEEVSSSQPSWWRSLLGGSSP
jgi:hypothetical protein